MKKAIDTPLTLKEVAKHFKQWRNIKRKGERIPERLWREAVGLLGTYGVSQVIRTLHLSSKDLNKHRRIIEADQRKPDSGNETGFVEIDPTLVDQTLEPNASAAWMEMERPDGLRLRIQAAHRADMLVLIDHFMEI